MQCSLTFSAKLAVYTYKIYNKVKTERVAESQIYFHCNVAEIFLVRDINTHKIVIYFDITSYMVSIRIRIMFLYFMCISYGYCFSFMILLLICVDKIYSIYGIEPQN